MSAANRRPRPARAALAALTALAALALLAGCGSDKHTAPVVKGPQLPPGTPQNTAPDSTILRWVAAYAAGVEGEADTLLAADFRYRFSQQTDPALASHYGDNWRRTDEVLSLDHLLHGFTNGQGAYLPPATAMTAQVVNPLVVDDTDHADSTAWYKRVLVTRLLMAIDVASAEGGVTYNVDAAFNLALVRGDAAVLVPGQSASPERWYVRECDDLTVPLAGVAPASADGPTPTATTSWGRVRAQYR